jgi:hypothetical protein
MITPIRPPVIKKTAITVYAHLNCVLRHNHVVALWVPHGECVALGLDLRQPWRPLGLERCHILVL